MKSEFVVLLLCTLCSACGSASSLQRIQDPQILSLPAQNQIVLLNFWATWCEPCTKEIPILIRLHTKFPDLKVIGVSLDAVENAGAVKKFIRKYQIPYHVMLRSGSQFDETMSKFDPKWTGGLPATFLFRNGQRIYSSLGIIQEAEITAILGEAGVPARHSGENQN